MKKFILTLALSILVGGYSYVNAEGNSEGVKFKTGTFTEILKNAKADKNGPKYIFVDCYTKWCGPCKMVASKIFPTKEAGDYFNKNFVNVKMDMESPEGKEFNKTYQVTAYPTFFVLDLNGKEINRMVGAEIDTKWLIKKAEGLKDHTKSVSYLKEKFEKSGYEEDAVNYLNALYALGRYNKDITPFLEENITIFKPYTLFSYDFWKFMKTALSYFGDSKKIANLVVENKKYASYGVGSAAVNSALYDFYTNQIQKYLTGKKDLTPAEADAYANNMRLLMGDFDTYESLLCDIYNFRKNNDTESEINILKGRDIHNMKDVNDAIRIQQILKKNPGITKEVWDEYTKSIDSNYDHNKNYEKRFIEK